MSCASTSPRKDKYHICVSPNDRLFLRINSDPPPVGPAHPLLKAQNDFLHHDSYVELLGLVRHESDVMRKAAKIGRLHKPQAEKLVEAAGAAPTLTPEQTRRIQDGLLSS
jgi:hypothetical protein